MNYSIDSIYLDHPCQKRLATGEGCGILLVQRGVAHVGQRWNIGTNELLICKPRQVLMLEHTAERYPLSAMWVEISTQLMGQLSTPNTDIPASFGVNPEPVVRIRGENQTLTLIKSLAFQMSTLDQEADRYAADLLEESSLKMFLALVLRTCVMSDLHQVQRSGHLAIDEVFRYIHTHLTEDLTLEQLEQEFFVSRNHLIRLFKRRCGLTVHQYIIKARLDLCRSYIEQGCSVTEVYRKGGFGGYNHFFRAFKQEYGMTPKAYYRTIFPDAGSPDGGKMPGRADTAGQESPDQVLLSWREK